MIFVAKNFTMKNILFVTNLLQCYDIGSQIFYYESFFRSKFGTNFHSKYATKIRKKVQF